MLKIIDMNRVIEIFEILSYIKESKLDFDLNVDEDTYDFENYVYFGADISRYNICVWDNKEPYMSYDGAFSYNRFFSSEDPLKGYVFNLNSE
jgi:hypothetical protein